MHSLDVNITLWPAVVQQQLERVLLFWQQQMTDTEHGGYWGAMNNQLLVQKNAAKGCVLHARILWTFATAAHQLNCNDYSSSIHHAYQFMQRFFDTTHGGVYWSLSADGQPLDRKKQVYAQAFAIYGLTAYNRYCGSNAALEQAIALYQCIEKHSFDALHGGYLEAFSEQWGPLADLRLSDKDANEQKTMNTHLHVLEAYAALYHLWPDTQLHKSILQLLQVFKEHIITPSDSQGLFFDEQWQRKDTLISFGHDIEAAWLLQEAATITGDAAWIQWSKQQAVRMALQAQKGIDEDGGMWHEMNTATGHWQKEKHWWPQAEAMVGYFNAWQNSGQLHFLLQAAKSWQFVQQYLLDARTGEWYWGIDHAYQYMGKEDYAGFWKCPYHNCRAYLELLKRLNEKND
jgi:mannobiose 2-epimerase